MLCLQDEGESGAQFCHIESHHTKTLAQNEAVIRLADWLTTLTVEREVANGAGGGAGKAKVVLCGHRFVGFLFNVCSSALKRHACIYSMGGLLAADCLLEFINTRPDSSAPLWPKIIACIAFDTPVNVPTLSHRPHTHPLYSILVFILRSSRTVPPKPPSTSRLLTRLLPDCILRSHQLHPPRPPRRRRLRSFPLPHLPPSQLHRQVAGVNGLLPHTP